MSSKESEQTNEYLKVPVLSSLPVEVPAFLQNLALTSVLL